jgi:hypothetical protein
MYKRLALLSIVFLTLVGCNKKAMSALGIKRGTPDEFTIIPNKPLTIPPMFDLKYPNSNENQHNVEKHDEIADNNALTQDDKKFMEKFENNKLAKNKKD